VSSVYLAHHGIKGQKWGVRRYQNPDGSYTDEGRRRRGISPKKRYSDLTDEEIAERIKRRQNELKLEELEMQSSIPIGARYIGGIVKSGATKGLTIAVGGITFAVVRKFLKENYDIDVPNLKK
jgi:hypothetical protein